VAGLVCLQSFLGKARCPNVDLNACIGEGRMGIATDSACDHNTCTVLGKDLGCTDAGAVRPSVASGNWLDKQ